MSTAAANQTPGDVADGADYHPLLPAARVDPYPYYRYLRQHEPVKFMPGMNAYAVSRNEDVRQVLLKHELFSNDPLIKIAFGAFNPAPEARYMLASDPPDHSRLRLLVNKAFSRRSMTEMKAEIVRTVARYLDRLDGREEFDFTEEFASPLPVSIVGDILGIETSAHADFRRWSNSVTAGGNDASLSAVQRAQIEQDASAFRDYFLERIAHARSHPQDNLISALVEAEEQGQKLTADEVLALCVLLLIAGNETTTSLLSNALIALRDFPEQERLVRADRTLVPNLVEESLRYLSPIQLLFRRATVDTEIAGHAIPRDAIVMPIYASANRDEAVFSQPDSLDVTRTDLRKHMAFGWGIHMCVGKALASVEGEIALNALFDRYSRMEIAIDRIDWCDAFYLRGPKHLPLRCTSA